MYLSQCRHGTFSCCRVLHSRSASGRKMIQGAHTLATQRMILLTAARSHNACSSSHERQLALLLPQRPAAYHVDRAAAVVAQFITETRDLVNTTILNACVLGGGPQLMKPFAASWASWFVSLQCAHMPMTQAAVSCEAAADARSSFGNQYTDIMLIAAMRCSKPVSR